MSDVQLQRLVLFMVFKLLWKIHLEVYLLIDIMLKIQMKKELFEAINEKSCIKKNCAIKWINDNRSSCNPFNCIFKYIFLSICSIYWLKNVKFAWFNLFLMN